MDMMTPAKITDPSNPIDALIARQPSGRALAQAFYTDPSVYQRDLDRVMRRHWMIAGHVGSIPNEGDYFQVQYDRDSIIISRGMDGKVRALANSCRHRGAQVCTEQTGNSRSFTCPYHGWAYGLDGALLAARQMPADFDKSKHGLAEIPCEVIQGLIMISLNKHPLKLDSLKKLVNDALEPYGLSNAKVAAQISFPINANWKLAVENYVECYHCAPAHPEYSMTHALEQPLETLGELVNEMETKAKSMGINTATTTEWRTSDTGEEGAYLLRYPMKKGMCTASKDGSQIAPFMGKFTDSDGGVSALHIGGLNFIAAYVDHVVLYRFIPLSHSTCELEVVWMVDKDAVEGKDYDKEQLTWLWIVTSEADKRIIEWNSAGVNSSYYVPGPIAPMEYNEKRWLDWYVAEIARA